MSILSKKTMWEQYRFWILGIVILSITIYMGIVYYCNFQNEKTLFASNLYGKIMVALKKGESAEAQNLAEILIKEEAREPYTSLSRLLLAKFSIENKDNTKAAQYLKDILKMHQKGDFHAIATVRLARIWVAEEKLSEAFDLLIANEASDAYVSLYEEIKGDIYSKQNEKDKAKEAYGKALKAMPKEPSLMAGLLLKYIHLGGSMEGL